MGKPTGVWEVFQHKMGAYDSLKVTRGEILGKNLPTLQLPVLPKGWRDKVWIMGIAIKAVFPERD